MVTEEYILSTERTDSEYEHRYGGMNEKDIDRIHPCDRALIEEMHKKILDGNLRLRLITSEVKLK